MPQTTPGTIDRAVFALSMAAGRSGLRQARPTPEHGGYPTPDQPGHSLTSQLATSPQHVPEYPAAPHRVRGSHCDSVMRSQEEVPG
jgi:hypothetical protein